MNTGEPGLTPIRAKPTTDTITLSDRWDHLLARLGVNRMGHRVSAGLYALNKPSSGSPVFVTANYTLSFDALRRALRGNAGYILVLETYGVNVWCAAGKGTFGTDELIRRMESTGLRDVVKHRSLILPQLGATGVAAHEVLRRTGFKVEFGPVRAEDLPEYLKTGRATPEMRRVRFGLSDRAILIPVEATQVLLPMVVGAAAVFLLGGLTAALAVVASVLAGAAVFPILLPWLPTRDFTSKGLVLGLAAALPFAVAAFVSRQGSATWVRFYYAAIPVLALPPVTSFLALNFTGATTFTSKSGVRREMFKYIPGLAVFFAAGIALAIGYFWVRRAGI